MAECIIGGEQVGSKIQTETRNPATGEVVDRVPQMTVEDTRRAIEAADRALAGWSQTPTAKRGEILYKAAQLLREKEQELARLLTCEQGKPLRESVMELRRCAHTLEHYAGFGKNLRGGYVPLLEEGKYGLILKRPIGVCAAIVPWNFPVSLMCNKIAPALLAGNTVVVKPATTTPLTAIKCVELLHQAGLPPGVLNIVTGPGSTVGEELLQNPKVRKIGFTGSTPTGRHVMEAAAPQIKRLTLELGGSDPMIVADDADLERAVSAASVGRFFNCGQACLAIKRLYLFEKIADEFIEKLVKKVQALTVGNGLDPRTNIGPVHTTQQRQEIEAMVEDAMKRGAKILVGGKRPEGEEYAKGFFYLPTLLTHVAEDSRIVREECFGPALPIFRVKDWEEAIEKANDSIYGLGSSIWSKNLEKALWAAERIEAGYTWVNSNQIIYDELPFGGFKQSGYGKEHGSEALEHYLETKSVVVAPG